AERERAPRHALVLAQQQHERAGEERHDDRQDRQMVEQAAHYSGSRPSTWSVPVSPRSARSTTRKSAVVAKPITIAVSTSAWGTGSAWSAASAGAPSRMGGRCISSRPMPKMK